MTYQEALEFKNRNYGNIIVEKDAPHYVIIVPKLQNEYSRLIHHIQNDFSLYNDELCLQFCSNNQYKLMAVATEEGKEVIVRNELRKF
jgi:hypothetical protein